MGSYNCRGFNVSKIPAIKELLNDCDVLLIQETWLLPHELNVFSKNLIGYNCYGVSGMKSEVLYHGRPFGGCSVLFNSALSHCIDFINLNCRRLCCIKLRTPSYELYVFNVYLPCNTNNENDSYDYNEVLSIISHYCCNNQVIYRIIVGDLNIDFFRLGSNNTISLKLFLEEEYMSCVLDLFSNDVPRTFIGINGTRTLIDHFLLSDNIIHDVIGYSTIDLIDNLSDHLPLFVVFKCSVSYVHALPHIFNGRPNCRWSDSKTIKFYKTVLDIKLKEIVFPLHLLSCTNISCDNHIADIEYIYSHIVNACIISTSITVQYQRKVTSSRNITPGWNQELDYARESSLFWKRMWIQCEKTISGVVHGLKCTTKTKYRHILRSLKSIRNKYIKQSICQRVLRNNNKVYWNEIRKIRKSTIQLTYIIDDCDDNTYIAGL